MVRRKKPAVSPAIQARIDKEDKARGRAWAATKAFTKMIPQLTSYAKAVSRDSTIRVQATAGQTRTDGGVIYIRPPLKLADNTPHHKSLCAKRDSLTHRQQCPACDIREMVMACVYHEIAHIVFGTMVEPTVTGMAPLLEVIGEWHPSDVCDHAEKIRKAVFEYVANGEKQSYLMWAGLFDMRLKMLINALEDARVNTSMFDARPGTRAMMDANVAEVFEAGIEIDNDEENLRWQDRSIDEQIFIGTFLAASEYFEFIDTLADEATAVLENEDISTDLMIVARTNSIHDVVAQTIKLWRKFQSMGHFVLPKCVKQEDEDENVPDSGSGSGESGDQDQLEQGSPEQQDPSDAASGGGSGEAGSDGASSEGTSGVGSGERPTPSPDREGPDPESGKQGVRDDELQDDEGEGDSGGTSSSSSSGDDAAGGNAGEGEPSGTGNGSGDDQADGVAESDDGRPDSDDDTEGGESPADGDEDDTDTQDLLVDDGVGGDSEVDAIRKTLQEISLHRLIEKVNPESNTKQFACGHSDTDAGHSDAGNGDDNTGLGDLGSVGDDEVAVTSGGWGGGDIDEENDDDEDPHLKIALSQILFFDVPSMGLSGMDIVEFPSPRLGWFENQRYPEQSDIATFMPGEQVIGRLSMEARLLFEENRRNKYTPNLKRGRVSARHLGRRAPVADPRMMRKKQIPGKLDWHVVIGMDCSGSNDRMTRDGLDIIMNRAKRAVAAQTEMLSRIGTGVTFEVWAHTAGYGGHPDNRDATDVTDRGWILSIKKPTDSWDKKAKVKLASLEPSAGNVDGHTLQFYRKQAERSNAAGKIICYYTDGAMPAMNFHEELEVLKAEIKVCKDKGFNLLAVGIETDSPEEHGFDTVKVDSDDDLIKVVRQLKRAITGSV